MIKKNLYYLILSNCIANLNTNDAMNSKQYRNTNTKPQTKEQNDTIVIRFFQYLLENIPLDKMFDPANSLSAKLKRLQQHLLQLRKDGVFEAFKKLQQELQTRQKNEWEKLKTQHPEKMQWLNNPESSINNKIEYMLKLVEKHELVLMEKFFQLFSMGKVFESLSKNTSISSIPDVLYLIQLTMTDLKYLIAAFNTKYCGMMNIKGIEIENDKKTEYKKIIITCDKAPNEAIIRNLLHCLCLANVPHIEIHTDSKLTIDSVDLSSLPHLLNMPFKQTLDLKRAKFSCFYNEEEFLVFLDELLQNLSFISLGSNLVGLRHNEILYLPLYFSLQNLNVGIKKLIQKFKLLSDIQLDWDNKNGTLSITTENSKYKYKILFEEQKREDEEEYQYPTKSTWSYGDYSNMGETNIKNNPYTSYTTGKKDPTKSTWSYDNYSNMGETNIKNNPYISSTTGKNYISSTTGKKDPTKSTWSYGDDSNMGEKNMKNNPYTSYTTGKK